MTTAFERHPCPLLIMRVPAADTTLDHLVFYHDADALAHAETHDEVLTVCGERLASLTAHACWCRRHPLCPACMDVLHGIDFHGGRHRLREEASNG